MERVDYESMVIQELANAHDRGELDVAPWYQRRAVWTNAQKSYLINSIFERMPLPAIFIRHTLDLEEERTIKEVVDGQQRLRSILEYKANDFAARHPDHPRRVRYEALTPPQRQAFLMTKLPIAYLVGAEDSDVIEIFGRLNAVSKNLNAQEKRAAKYSGEFHQFCLRQAVERLAIWRDLGIFSATDISRMAEVQFIAELSMALAGGMQDFSAARVDSAYARWDEDFPARDTVERRLDRLFGSIAGLAPEVVRSTIFSRSPVFYTLALVLNDLNRVPVRRALEQGLRDIDARFNDPRPASERPEEDLAFVAACMSSTQRIRSRTVRFTYIRSFF